MTYIYSGAPDECGRHWPEKLNENGDCESCSIERRLRADQEEEIRKSAEWLRMVSGK